MTDREKNTLIDILNKSFAEQYEKRGLLTAPHTADHLLANGVIVPPCKVGDKVYQYDTAGDIYESEITQIVYDTKFIAFDERAIGKTVFLTLEEAENALAERKENGSIS